MGIVERNTSYYESIAGQYDTATQKGKWRANTFLKQHLPPLGSARDYLDIGAGTGQTVQAVDNLLSPDKIVAVDVSAKMLEILASKTPRAETVQSTATEFAANNKEAYDLVTAMGVCEFMPQLPAFLADVGSLLNSEGVFAFTYEPIVGSHRSQSKRKSETKTSPDGKQNTFITLRWHPHEVHEALKRWQPDVLADTLFVAYERDGVPVIYSLVVVRK